MSGLRGWSGWKVTELPLGLDEASTRVPLTAGLIARSASADDAVTGPSKETVKPVAGDAPPPTGLVSARRAVVEARVVNRARTASVKACPLVSRADVPTLIV